MSREAEGRAAYEADLVRKPFYRDGVPRPKWDQLRDFAQDSWIRNPTPKP